MSVKSESLKPCIFLDRDKVLNKDTGYVFRVEELVLLPKVGQGLKRLKEAGYTLIVISNQSGIGRGKFVARDADIFHEAMNAELKRDFGVTIDLFLYCPHMPDFGCNCRKPGTGLIEQARAKIPIDMKKSWMIGDRHSDVDCGINAGLRTVHVLTGDDRTPHPKATGTANDLMEVADIVLGRPSIRS